MTGLLPREAPMIISADPIPTDMRTDIQPAVQGFTASVPLTDSMHKIKRQKRQKADNQKD